MSLLAPIRSALSQASELEKRSTEQLAEIRWPRDSFSLIGSDLLRLPDFVRIGYFEDHNSIPALLSLSDTLGVAFVHTKAAAEACRYLQATAVSVLGSLDPQVARCFAYDPKNLGANLRILTQLPNREIQVAVTESELNAGLQTVLDSARSTLQDFVTFETDLSDYNSSRPAVVRPFHVIAIANFPIGLTRSHLLQLVTLLDNAKAAGIRVFLTTSPDLVDTSRDSGEAEEVLQRLCQISVEGKSTVLQRSGFDSFFMGRPVSLSVPTYEELIGAIDDASQDAVAKKGEPELSMPIGKSSRGRLVALEFGNSVGVHHAMIAGQSGSGKSVLLANLLLGAMEKYRPEELQFGIIDCKGTEFPEFADESLPHVWSFCSSGSIETTLSAVERVEAELEMRQKTFNDAGVRGLEDYNARSSTPIPRLVCIVDEFQVLLMNGKVRQTEYAKKVLVDLILRQGRSFGIHLIACTQSVGRGVSQSFLDNIPVRIALNLTRDQSSAFLGMGNSSAVGLPVGSAIYNPSNGDKNHNTLASITYLSSEHIRESLTQIRHQHAE